MRRIIGHWTCGAPKANAVDLAAYHLLLEGDGKLVAGTHSISDNVNTSDGDYAAHTRGCNAGSIGVSMCAMAFCQEKPFKPGPYPVTREQWDAMILAVADCCQAYGIPVTKQTVLGHGEVQGTLGITQRGKWDPLRLPWEPGLSYAEVGDLMRDQVAEALEPPARLAVVIAGRRFEGADAMLLNEQSLVALRPAADALGWRIVDAAGGLARLTVAGKTVTVPLVVEGGRGFVSCRELAGALEWSAGWDAKTRTVALN